MSTTAPPIASQTASAKGTAEALIHERIVEACKALWWAELIRAVLRTLIVTLVALLVWVVIDHWVFSPSVLVRVLAFAGLVGWIGWQIVTQVIPLLSSSVRPEYAARSLEQDLPGIKQQLTSYVTLKDGQGTGLGRRVIHSIGSRVAGRLNKYDALPAEATGTFKWWITAAVVLASLLGYALFSPKNSVASWKRLVAPLASIESPKRVAITEVKPGDAEAIAGREVDVGAEVGGLREGEPVWVRWENGTELKEAVLESEEVSREFVGKIKLDHSASGKVAYRIEAGDASSGPHWLNVKNVPVVALQSVRYEPPAYTGEVAHTTGSGAITAVDGTKITVRAKTNRPIAKAVVEFNPKMLGEAIRATAGTRPMKIDEDGTGLEAAFSLRSSVGRTSAVEYESYRIRVWDDAEQSNPEPIIYPIQVIADLPPEISIVTPRESPKKLPVDAQQIIEVHAMDPDFGLKQVSLKVKRGITMVIEPSLWSDEKGAKGNQVAEFRFRPSEHGLRVGDVVRITAHASDNRLVPEDPSIEPNEAVTDAIELRIIESAPVPDTPDGNDGLSEPDQRPASDDRGDKKSQSDSQSEKGGEGDKQSGGGGAGEGTSSKQEGDPEGGGAGGSSDNKNTDSESEATESQEPGEGNPNSDSNSSNNPDDANPSGENQPNGDANPDGKPTGNSDPSSNKNSDPNSKPSADSSSGDPNANPQDPSDPNSDPADPQDPQDQAGSPDAQSDSSQGNPSDADPKNSKDPSQGSPSNQDQSGDPRDGERPKHDGEAMERLLDHIKNKKKEQSPKGSGDQQNPETNSQENNDQQEPGSDDKDKNPDGSGTEQDQTSKEPGADGESSKDPGDKSRSQQDASEGQGSDPDSRPPETEKPDGGKGESGNKDDSKDSNDPSSQNNESKDPKSDPTSDPKSDSNSDAESKDGSNTGEGTDPKDKSGDGSRDPQNKDDAGAADNKKPGSDPESNDPNDPSAGKPEGNQSKDGSEPKGSGGENDPKNKDDSGSGDQDKGEPSDARDPNSDPSSEPQEKNPKSDSGQPKDDGKPGGDPSDPSDPSDKGEGENDDKGEGGKQPEGQPNKDPSQGKPGSQGNNTPQDPKGPKGDSKQQSPPQNPSSNPSSNPDSGSAPNSNDSSPKTQPNGNNAGQDAGDSSVAPPPAEPDVEYTKKATDMVLDYLKETKDKPDRELLEKLNWTEEDMKRFSERWEKVREIQQQPSAEPNSDVEEALRSLGMRPPAKSGALQNQDKADSFRGLRDSGNRKPPPTAYRDVFESFRRAVGKEQP